MGTTILIVDDDIDNLRMFEIIVRSLGYQTVTRLSGIDILDDVEGIQPSIIILDLFLPGLDGFSIIKKLKKHPDYRYIPVVAVTAVNQTANRQTALEAGCDFYLPKPFTRNDIADILQQFVPG